MKITIPVSLAVKCFYRTVITVDKDASKDEIEQAIIDMVCAEQDSALDTDPSMAIEPDDIEIIDVEYDYAWDAWEDDEDEEDVSTRKNPAIVL